jgi:hypothetical protein
VILLHNASIKVLANSPTDIARCSFFDFMESTYRVTSKRHP